MFASVRLPNVDGKPVFEFQTSYNRPIYVAGYDLEDAHLYASRNALFWDEKITEDSGKLATVTVYVGYE